MKNESVLKKTYKKYLKLCFLFKTYGEYLKGYGIDKDPFSWGIQISKTGFNITRGFRECEFFKDMLMNFLRFLFKDVG